MSDSGENKREKRGKGGRDLTQGSITAHVVGMAAFIAMGMLVQTLYFLVDLYFVSHLGPTAVAGVSSAGTTWFICMGATQLIAVGALSLISRAVGAKDDDDAQLVFEQAAGLSLLFGAATLALGYTAGLAAVSHIAADAASAAAGRQYLAAFLPSLAMMFPMAAMVAALRACGVVGPPMMIQTASVGLNVILAPILIVGWGTGHPLGVAGAGLATTIATVLAMIVLLLAFPRMQSHLKLRLEHMKPRLEVWRRIAGVGAPAAAEFVVLFTVVSVVYVAIRHFGAEAQAGFGIGARVSQSIFLPAMAVAFAAAPIAGQNFGARNAARVIETFKQVAIIGSIIMLALALLCHVKPEVLIWPFSRDPAVVAVAASYLRINSWNFVAMGLIFSCSGMFQALGDTRPALMSSATRIVTFVIPALWMSTWPQVRIEDFWKLSVVSITLQAVFSLWLLRGQLRKKLDPLRAEAAAVPA